MEHFKNSTSCRCCGSSAIKIIPNGAVLAPFFAKRVFGISSLALPYPKPWKLTLLDRLSLHLVSKILSRGLVSMDASLCTQCGYHSTTIPIPDEQLVNLYHDYRQPSYNTDRDLSEPGYLDVSVTLGGKEETKYRREALINYLQNHLSLRQISDALDYGSADGGLLPFTPDTSTRLYAFDVSDTSVINGVHRITNPSQLNSYDYIQCCHVLEHVSRPSQLVATLKSHCRPLGHLYLEVPLEVPDTVTYTSQVLHGDIKLLVHEHLCRFTPSSIRQLLLSHDLTPLDISVENVNYHWGTVPVIRALGVNNSLPIYANVSTR